MTLTVLFNQGGEAAGTAGSQKLKSPVGFIQFEREQPEKRQIIENHSVLDYQGLLRVYRAGRLGKLFKLRIARVSELKREFSILQVIDLIELVEVIREVQKKRKHE